MHRNIDDAKNWITTQFQARPLEALTAAGAVLVGIAKIAETGVKASNARTWRKEVVRRQNNSK